MTSLLNGLDQPEACDPIASSHAHESKTAEPWQVRQCLHADEQHAGQDGQDQKEGSLLAGLLSLGYVYLGMQTAQLLMEQTKLQRCLCVYEVGCVGGRGWLWSCTGHHLKDHHQDLNSARCMHEVAGSSPQSHISKCMQSYGLVQVALHVDEDYEAALAACKPCVFVQMVSIL